MLQEKMAERFFVVSERSRNFLSYFSDNPNLLDLDELDQVIKRLSFFVGRYELIAGVVEHFALTVENVIPDVCAEADLLDSAEGLLQELSLIAGDAMPARVAFSAMTANQQRSARAMFFDARDSDAFLYELGRDGCVMCRRRDAM